MSNLSENEILQRVRENPNLMNIIENYDILSKENRIIVLPVKFGTILYGVRQYNSGVYTGAKYYSNVYPFEFSKTHIDKIGKMGTEYFKDRNEAEKYKRELDRIEEANRQKYLKKNVKAGDNVISEEYGRGIVHHFKYNGNEISYVYVVFTEIAEPVCYSFDKFVEGNTKIERYDTLK